VDFLISTGELQPETLRSIIQGRQVYPPLGNPIAGGTRRIQPTAINMKIAELAVSAEKR
jgi:hypothetical protein